MPTLPKKQRPDWLPKYQPFERMNIDTFYHSQRWRKTRKLYLKNNPLCVMCKEKGLLVNGNVVDHVIPIKKGGEPLDLHNLQTLCFKCHSSKSGKDK